MFEFENGDDDDENVGWRLRDKTWYMLRGF